MEHYEDKSSCYIYFAVFASSFTTFVTGFAFVWTSPFLPKFSSPDPAINPIGREITTFESSWIVSTMALGLILGPPLTIVCLKFFTKKTVLLISMAPMLLANVTCCFAKQPSIFILARLLMGIGTGAIWSVLGTYIGEISEDKNRGLLGSIPGIMSNLGSLLVYVIGPYLNMVFFSLVIIVPSIIFYIVFGLFVPNSPYDLVIRGSPDEAEVSLKRLRRRDDVEKELAFIKETIVSGSKEKVEFKDLIRDRGLRKGLLICASLMIFQQLSGILVIVSYAETIFQLAGDLIPSSISAVVLGTVGTTTNLISLVLVDKMGRKVLLATSCALLSISLFALGLYFYRMNLELDVSFISWVPIASLMLYMVAFNLAMGIVPWIITGEVFHSSVKALASFIISMTNFTVSFCLSICFPYMVILFGMGWTFWTLAVFMIMGATFCNILLPETKGKNFQEIQELLKIPTKMK